MVKSSSQQGYLFKQLLVLISMLLLLFVPTILSQKILIEKIDSKSQSNTGVLVYQIMNQKIPVSGLAVFGWIRISSTTESGIIFQVYTDNSPPSSDSASKVNQLEDLLFSTQYLSWGNNSLQFTHNHYGSERQKVINLSPEELKEWIFIYAGHSFQENRQNYYVKKGRISFSLTAFDIDVNQQKFYQITAGTNKFLGKQFFIGDFQRLTLYVGDYAYRETDFEDLHTFHPQDFPSCSFSFGMCAYLGDYEIFCQDPASNPKRTIKSVLLEKGKTLNGCVDTVDGKQKMIQFNQSIECVTKENLNDLQDKEIITFIEHPSSENPCNN